MSIYKTKLKRLSWLIDLQTNYKPHCERFNILDLTNLNIKYSILKLSKTSFKSHIINSNQRLPLSLVENRVSISHTNLRKLLFTEIEINNMVISDILKSYKTSRMYIVEVKKLNEEINILLKIKNKLTINKINEIINLMKNLITMCLMILALMSCKEEYVEPVEEVNKIEELSNYTMYTLDTIFNRQGNENSIIKIYKDNSNIYELSQVSGFWKLPTNDTTTKIKVLNISEDSSIVFVSNKGIRKSKKHNNYSLLQDGGYKIKILDTLNSTYLYSRIMVDYIKNRTCVINGSSFTSSIRNTSSSRNSFYYYLMCPIRSSGRDRLFQLYFLQSYYSKNPLQYSVFYEADLGKTYIGEIQFIKQ